MKNQPEPVPASTPKTINQLIKLLAANALPSASRNKSFIVNDVPAAYNIIADENMLATVISRLLYTLVNHTENSCIRITANEYDDIIFVHMKSNRGFDNNSIDNELQQAQAYAKKMNGNIGLSRDEGKVTGISFSFPNMDFVKKENNPSSENKTEPISNLY